MLYNLKQIMTSKVPFFGFAFLFFVSGNSFLGLAEEASKMQWTVVEGAKKSSPAQNPSPEKKETQGKSMPLPKKEVAPVPSASPEKQVADIGREMEMEKAVKGTQHPNLFQSTEVTRETISFVMAPYHEQKKTEFLAQTDHGLADVVKRAQSVHTQAKAAQEGISLAQRRLLLSIRHMLPELSFEYGHRDGSLSAAEYLSRSEKATIRQPLFRGGVLWNSFLEERKSLEAAKSNYQMVMDDLILEVSKVYFEYQRARAVEIDQQKAIEAIKPQVRISDEKFKANMTSEIEHLNAQSLAGQVEFDNETAKQEMEIAKLDLQRFLALGMHDTLSLKSEYDVDKVIASMPEDDLSASKIENALGSFSKGQPIPSLEKLVEMSYGHRAELNVRMSELQAARYSEKARWGGFVPKADLLLEYGALSEALKIDTNNADHHAEFRCMLEVNWNAMGNKVGYTYEKDHRAPSVTQFQSGQGTISNRQSFTVGLLDGLDALVDVKQAEVDKLNKVVELEQAEKKVLEDVKRAYYEYQKALIQMKSATKRVQWRHRLRDLAQHRLSQKEVEVSEYLQSEIDLLKERGEFHTALKDYYTAKASLNYAVGVHEFMAVEKNGKI